MKRHFHPRAVLRHLPAALLRRFCEGEQLDLDIDPAEAEVDVEAVFAGWLGLPDRPRRQFEWMLREVDDMADPVAVRLLAEEAVFQSAPLPADLDATYGLHAVVLWAWLNRPTVFHHVRLLRRADLLPGRYWHRSTGLPAEPPDHSPEVLQDLKVGVGEYLRREQGRAQRCSLEYHERGTGERYYFLYPDDYTRTHVGHDEFGKLHRIPVKPAFEVVFAFDPAAGTLDTYCPGPKAVRQDLEARFCDLVVGAYPADRPPHDPAFELNALLAPNFRFATDPADGVSEVRVKRARVALPNTRRRLVLEPDPDRPPADLYAFFDETLPPDRYPRELLNVTAATLVITYQGGGGDRPRTLTFDVTYPNSCSLKSEADDRRALGERCLRRWGIARA